LGERPPFLWRDAATRWLTETRKRSKRKDESILAWFDEHLNQYDVQAITREVVQQLRALKAAETSESTADRHMALLRWPKREATLDMNLSPQWVDRLNAVGVSAVHWSTIGKVDAPDAEVMAYAATHVYIVVTHDLDFSAISRCDPVGRSPASYKFARRI
jgi:hypothetical protein